MSARRTPHRTPHPASRTPHGTPHRTPHSVPRAPHHKRFGQHFLEPAWAAKVVGAIAPHPSDLFIEIGPGRGALTNPLAAAAAHVIAVEIDRNLAAALRSAAPPNVTVIAADFLEASVEQLRSAVAAASLPFERLRIAGNLPYNVASPILFTILDLYKASFPFVDATVMVQREVAARLMAAPGTHDYGVLTLLIRQSADVSRLLALPPGAFRPAPKVHSAVVRLRPRPPATNPRNPNLFVDVIETLFTRRRKILSNAIASLNYRRPGILPDAESIGRVLEASGLNLHRRPETLTLQELARLSDAIDANLTDPPTIGQD